MELAEYLLLQFLQPCFYYSLLLAGTAFLAVTALLRINRNWSSEMRSMLYLIPLMLPLAIFIIFPPTAWITVILPPDLSAAASTPLIPFQWTGPQVESFLSVTGLIVMIGAVLALSSLLISITLGDRMARRLLKVIDMSGDDFPEVRTMVVDLSARMGVKCPRIGLVEDLRPNAFVLGRGKRTSIVFSLGLLELLEGDELKAVIAHEMAHIKHDDTWFKTVTQALAVLSYFNPLSFLAMRAARREREKLADLTASNVLGSSRPLISAISRVTEVLSHSNGAARDTGLGLLGVSSLAERTSLLSTHPSFNDRVKSVEGRTGRALPMAACVLLSGLVIIGAIMLTVGVGEIHADLLIGQPGLLGSLPHGAEVIQPETFELSGHIDALMPHGEALHFVGGQMPAPPHNGTVMLEQSPPVP